MRPTGVALLASVWAACIPPRVWDGLSPDHRTEFRVSASHGRFCVRIAGESEGCYDGVALHDITFSSDSRSVAYPVREGGHWFVMHDGRPGPPADGIAGLVLSGNGTRLAYAALRGDVWHVVVDGRYGEPFDALFSGSLRFDASGQRVAFAAERGGRAAVVIDGRIGPPYDGIGDLEFSPDGRHLGYVAREGSTARLIVDGTGGSPHDAISEFRFAPSGPGTAYLARDAGRWFMIHGDTRLGPYASARALTYALGGSLIFVAGDGATERVVIDGRPGPAFETVDDPAVAHSGATWGYIGHDSTASTVVLNGEVLDTLAWASDLVIAPDGSRYAYSARRSDVASVISDRGQAVFDLVVDSSLVFTRSGAWACLVGDWRRRRLMVVVEGHRGRRKFDWFRFAQVAQIERAGNSSRELAAHVLRAWVTAEAELIVTGGH